MLILMIYSSEIYHGPSAFSEPETNAVQNFLLGKANQVKVFILTDHVKY